MEVETYTVVEINSYDCAAVLSRLSEDYGLDADAVAKLDAEVNWQEIVDAVGDEYHGYYDEGEDYCTVGWPEIRDAMMSRVRMTDVWKSVVG